MRVCLSANSDIGSEICISWSIRGYKTIGTFRNWNENCDRLVKAGITLEHLDLQTPGLPIGLQSALEGSPWDVLVSAAGTLEPIGLFKNSVIQEWEESFSLNFGKQASLIHSLLKYRKPNAINSIIMFAGGGTNNAPTHYSAYTLAKITTIKFCELLNEEMDDCKVTALGPGWVRTKIHEQTLKAGAAAGRNFNRTKEMLGSSNLVDISRVVNCVEWIIGSSKELIGGRNISVAHDPWGASEFEEKLRNSSDSLKLRRKE